MCGLAGFVEARPGTVAAELADSARRMADTLIHRGPDSAGVWVDAEAGIALGHRRLAIIDRSDEGAQPMTSADGRYVIAYNGEVYNFPDLRAELEAKGHRFRGRSDTEVVLAAIVEWGTAAALSRFVGMFAFALWDREPRRLTLARDRLGIKPLYYGRANGCFGFASEMRALAAHPRFCADVDREALSLYLQRNCVPAPHSIYRGVRKLEPGTLLTLDAGAADPKIETYWSLREAVDAGRRDPFEGDEHDAAGHLHDILADAVKVRMIADVPLGVFLSGGIDSSTVTALMQTASEKPVKTYTIGFEDSEYDEADDARAVARHLGTDHHALTLTAAEARDVVPRLGRMYDEPFSDVSQIPTFLVSEMAKREVTVVLSGDGGDEAFGGYNRHLWGQNIAEWAAGKPAGVLCGAARAMTLLAPESWDTVFARLRPVLPRSLRQRSSGEKMHKVAGMLTAGDAMAMYRVLISHWKRPADVVIGGAEPSAIASACDSWADLPDFTQQMLYLDTRTYLPDDILTKVDRASMAVSLETRVPILDHRVIEFAWRLPLAMKIHNGVGKRLLRQVLYRYVPRRLVDRPKMGFAVPIREWLRGPLREWAEELLAPARLGDEGYFAPGPIAKLWEEHLARRRDWHHHLWDVLMFQAWLEAQRQSPARG